MAVPDLNTLFPVMEQRALCPGLYARLVDLFGSVTVANEGASMTTNVVYDYTKERYQNAPIYSGEYYRVNCPFCGDTKKRLWINHMYGQTDPGNGRPMWWLATCYNESCLRDFENGKRLREAIFGFENHNTRDREHFEVLQGEVFDGTLGPVEWPGEVLPLADLPDNHPAVEWLAFEKRYTREMMRRYQLQYCIGAKAQYGTAQNRIVFPVIMENQLVGWQCRYVGTTNWKLTPKYYTLPGMKKRFILYNFDLARQMPCVVVCEGPTSANAVGDHAVALFGKEMSPQQMNLLVTHWPRKPIIMLLDPDAKEQMRGITRDLIASGTNPVVNVNLPEGTDPNDLDRHTVWNFIYHAANAVGITL